MTLENPLERAFELARGGECGDLRELELRLKREGYERVTIHLAGPSVRRQLRELMAKVPVSAD
jgi:hypothetical protein